VEDILLLEQPTSSMLEGVIDVFHVDLSLERHIVDDFQIDDGLPCTFSRPYFNPLYHWIELTCVGTCFPIADFCIGYHACHVVSICSHIVMKILTYFYVTFDVALFWFFTKHKERVHGIDEILEWLHWLFDFTWHLISS
jgi:hypothetical protein